MLQLANRVLLSAVVGVLVALIGSMVLASNGMFTMLMVVVLAPVFVVTIPLAKVIDRVVHVRWIELDCLPPYRTRSRYE